MYAIQPDEKPVKSRHIYNCKWELTYRWLKASKFGRKHYYCCCCQKDLKLGAGLANVEMHATREKHMKNESIWEGKLLCSPAALDVAAVADDDADDSASSCPPNKTERAPARSRTEPSRQTLELREAENQLKEAVTILHNITKRDLENKDDEYDLFGKILAKKLRKLPDIDSEVLMHEINAIVMNKMRHRVDPSPNNRLSVTCAERTTMNQTIHLSSVQPSASNLQSSSSLGNATVVRFTPLYTCPAKVTQPTEVTFLESPYSID